MLVLSRQRDESIMLDFASMTVEEFELLKTTPIELTTVDIRGDKVRTGIDAPRCVAVHRREVWDDIRRESRAAVSAEAASIVAEADAQLADVRKHAESQKTLMMPDAGL